MPERVSRELLMAVGCWPARSHSHVRMAERIGQAGVRDLVELEIPGTTAEGWLAALLPQR